MKIKLINSFRKRRNLVLTWISKQDHADWLLYLSFAIGFMIGTVVIIMQKLYVSSSSLISLFACCMFFASITTIIYFGIRIIIFFLNSK